MEFYGRPPAPSDAALVRDANRSYVPVPAPNDDVLVLDADGSFVPVSEPKAPLRRLPGDHELQRDAHTLPAKEPEILPDRLEPEPMDWRAKVTFTNREDVVRNLVRGRGGTEKEMYDKENECYSLATSMAEYIDLAKKLLDKPQQIPSAARLSSVDSQPPGPAPVVDWKASEDALRDRELWILRILQEVPIVIERNTRELGLRKEEHVIAERSLTREDYEKEMESNLQFLCTKLAWKKSKDNVSRIREFSVQNLLQLLSNPTDARKRTAEPWMREEENKIFDASLFRDSYTNKIENLAEKIIDYYNAHPLPSASKPAAVPLSTVVPKPPAMVIQGMADRNLVATVVSHPHPMVVLAPPSVAPEPLPVPPFLARVTALRTSLRARKRRIALPIVESEEDEEWTESKEKKKSKRKQPPVARKQDVVLGEKEPPPKGRQECVVCLEKLASMLLLPCKHVCVCKGCSERLAECPLCRAKIAEKIEPFF